MSSRKEIQQELEKIAPELAQMEIRRPFAIPDGYFTQLPAVIAARISTLGAESVQEESEALSPLLSELPKKMPFSVPEGYFEHLPGAAMKQDQSAGKLVNMPRRGAGWRFTAAAAVLLIIAGIWMYSGNHTVSPTQTVAEVVDDTNHNDTAARQDLFHYVQYVSDDEIMQYVEPGPASANTYSTTDEAASGSPAGGEALSLLLAGITDQELENYLALSDI